MEFPVTSNGVTIEIKTQKITKGKTAGTEYSAPNVNDITLDQFKNFLGEQLFMDALVRPTLRRVALGIHKAASDAAKNDPEKYKELYAKYLSSFSAVGESVSVLKERLADLMEQLGDLDDPKILIVDGALPYFANVVPLNYSILIDIHNSGHTFRLDHKNDAIGASRYLGTIPIQGCL